MKFRNYINRFNRSNRILSDEDLLKMTLEKILDEEDAIMSQNLDIGIPTYSELESSPNTEWVEPTEDNQSGYWRSIIQQPETQQDIELLSEKPIETFVPINSNNPVLSTNITDNNILFNNTSEKVPLFKGGVQKYDFRYLNKILPDKYKNLNIPEAVQKAASKMPIDTVEREYYGLSTKLKDKEMVEDKTMEENDIYSLKDITDPNLSEYYKDYLYKMYNLDSQSPESYDKIKDKQIVVPKDTSRLYNYAKNSEALQKWVAENYERIKNGEEPISNSIEFSLGGIKGAFNGEKRGLYATLHNMDIKDARVNEDGSFELCGIDPYDFAHNKYYENVHDSESLAKETVKIPYTLVNNIANGQQEAEQIENFLFSMPIKYSQEELEKIRQIFMHRRSISRNK